MRLAKLIIPTLMVVFAASLCAQAPGAAAKHRRASEVADDLRDKAADRAGVDRARFRAAARRDKDLLVTSRGYALYACGAAPAPITVGTDTSAFTSPAAYPLSQTFKLHSRPGSARVIYLDFNGHTTSGTLWNDTYTAGADIVSSAYDIDGDPTAFSNEEQTVIQNVWRRTAEDFAAFDVDVTTEDPGPAAFGNGNSMRVVICEETSYTWMNEGPYSGYAWIGSFAWVGVDTPCFVFAPVAGNDEDGIAYVVPHEVGHTLGLHHMGQTNGTEYYAGHANWAPIMGTTYGAEVSHWCKGEYPLANNSEDELNIISTFIPYITYDHGVDMATATVVPGTSLAAGGVILDRLDRAWYKIHAGPGNLAVTGTVSTPSPNLKLSLSVYRADGTLLTSAVGNGTMGATLTSFVTDGDYYLVVDGVGSGSPLTAYNDYSSIGRFRLDASWSGPNVPPVAATTGSGPLSGIGPFPVSFIGTGSRDPDGTIVSYLWDFGDGTTSTLANPSHTYAIGEFTARLTVTDNYGATGTTTVRISSQPLPPKSKVVAVSAMSASWLTVSRTTIAGVCTVIISDNSGRPMPGATVNVSVSGLTSSSLTLVTDRSGKAVFKSPAIPTSAKGRLTFTVTGATLPGYYYYPLNNKASVFTLAR